MRIGSLTAIATAIAISAVVVIGGGGGGSNLANLWVDTNGGTCTRQATAGPYVDAQACSTFDAAFQASSNGDAILVKAGTYPAQRINNKTGSALPVTTLGPASGETVSVSDETTFCGADYLTVNGPMTFKSISNYFDGSATCIGSLATNDTFDGITIDYQYDTSACGGSVLGLQGNVVNFTLRNSDVKDSYNVKNIEIGSWTPAGTTYYPTNIVLEYNRIHNGNALAQCPAGNDVHTECLFTNKIQGLTLRGNDFYNCISTGNGIIGDTGSDALDPRDFLFENNVFEAAWNNAPCPCAIHSPGFDGFTSYLRGVNVFRYNLFETSFLSVSSPTNGVVDFYGNIGVPPDCSSGDSFAYNIWTSGTCGATDTTNANILNSSQFVAAPPTRTATVNMPSVPPNFSLGNWHYQGSSSMVNAGDPNSTCSAFGALGAGSSPCYPSVDKDGNARGGNTPDAGPYEKG